MRLLQYKSVWWGQKEGQQEEKGSQSRQDLTQTPKGKWDGDWALLGITGGKKEVEGRYASLSRWGEGWKCEGRYNGGEETDRGQMKTVTGTAYSTR